MLDSLVPPTCDFQDETNEVLDVVYLPLGLYNWLPVLWLRM